MLKAPFLLPSKQNGLTYIFILSYNKLNKISVNRGSMNKKSLVYSIILTGLAMLVYLALLMPVTADAENGYFYISNAFKLVSEPMVFVMALCLFIVLITISVILACSIFFVLRDVNVIKTNKLDKVLKLILKITTIVNLVLAALSCAIAIFTTQLAISCSNAVAVLSIGLMVVLNIKNKKTKDNE